MIYWLEQSEADVPPEDGWLSTGEAALLNGMRFPKRRADWRLGRWTAKLAVAAHLGLPADSEALADIEIRPAASGAPEVYLGGRRAPVPISLSHRAGLALCAIGDPEAAIGCDLELVEKHSDCFLIDYFTIEECKLLVEAPVAERPRLSTLLWGAKESVLKALQVGLRLDTRDVTVSPTLRTSSGWNSLQAVVSGERSFQGWWRNAGDLIRTVVADPPPALPIELEMRKGANRSAVPARF